MESPHVTKRQKSQSDQSQNTAKYSSCLHNEPITKEKPAAGHSNIHNHVIKQPKTIDTKNKK